MNGGGFHSGYAGDEQQPLDLRWRHHASVQVMPRRAPAHSPRRARRAQSLVEFALVLPIFLLIDVRRSSTPADSSMPTTPSPTRPANARRVAIVNQSTARHRDMRHDVGDRLADGLRRDLGPGARPGSAGDVVVAYRNPTDTAACAAPAHRLHRLGEGHLHLPGPYAAHWPAHRHDRRLVDDARCRSNACAQPNRLAHPPLLRDAPMFKPNAHDRGDERGQVLVIFVGGIIALLLGVALVVDGGNLMAQQRTTQNGSRRRGRGGHTVIAQYLMGGSSSDGRRRHLPGGPGRAGTPRSARLSTGRRPERRHRGAANYIDFKGDVRRRGRRRRRPMPAGAQGVQGSGSARIRHLLREGRSASDTFTATTQATAVTGTVTSLCRRAPTAACSRSRCRT